MSVTMAQMVAGPLLTGKIAGVRKKGLGKGVPNLGNGWDKGFTMPRYAIVRQPQTETVRRGCLMHTTGSGKKRRNDGPKLV